MRVLISRMRAVGRAREIHVRVACPPIIAPCFYGIDMSTISELFAPKFQREGQTQDEVYAEMARDLGADETINRQETDWGKAVFKATNRRGVDVVVDNVGAATYRSSLRSLRRGGRLLTVGNSSGPRFEFDNRLIFGKHLTIIGSTMGTSSDFQTVMGLIFQERLRAIIDTIYPLEQALAALHRLQNGDFMGKLVLQIR